MSVQTETNKINLNKSQDNPVDFNFSTHTVITKKPQSKYYKLIPSPLRAIYSLFNKKNVTVTINNRTDEVVEKTRVTSVKPANRAFAYFFPTITAIAGLIGLHYKIDCSGWLIFAAFCMMGKNDYVRLSYSFILSIVSLIGIYMGIEYSGWLLFAAFVIMDGSSESDDDDNDEEEVVEKTVITRSKK